MTGLFQDLRYAFRRRTGVDCQCDCNPAAGKAGSINRADDGTKNGIKANL